MFAIFNLGLQEFIILAVIGLLMVGSVVVVLLVVLLGSRGQRKDDSSGE
jgi:hypothetical protein